MTDHLASAKRIVVKVGSALLVDSAAGTLKRDWLASLAADIAELAQAKKEIIIVSSGAIALGRRALKLKSGPLRLEESQAAAATGQVRLAQAYVDAFHVHDIVVAQILLTLEDTEERRRYLNARETLSTLLSLNAIPVINENDTVATAEIRYGDNDRLGARVASMMQADMLVLLSDIDGLYTANPQRDPSATHIPEVRAITPEIERMAEGPVSGFSKGGMESKIAAAKIATAAGAAVIIANGHVLHPLRAMSGAARTTLFSPRVSPAQAKKRWIAGGLSALGTIVIDAGAERALLSGKSLLPAGVKAVTGEFERGDAVVVKSEDGRELARGLIAYNTADAKALVGRRTVDIEAVLGYRGRDEMIHRDDMAVTALGGATP
ncbi:MAG TPA: glutamate 5-kinase [Micropepsaceae bacterium]|jgi:glutamate 5-kinase|nr:glutamate 5-kinase [Micropepsaceae bacterium]